MTRHEPSDVQQVELARECDSCRVEAGHWCVTTGGHFTAQLHSARYWAARALGRLPLEPSAATAAAVFTGHEPDA